MDVFKTGEKVHIVEKRLFVDDVRRHFVGEVISFSSNAIRVKGYVWIYLPKEGKYIRRPNVRERVLILGDRIILNILPQDIDVKLITYNCENSKRHLIVDNKKFVMDISEFAGG